MTFSPSFPAWTLIDCSCWFSFTLERALAPASFTELIHDDIWQYGWGSGGAFEDRNAIRHNQLHLCWDAAQIMAIGLSCLQLPKSTSPPSGKRMSSLQALWAATCCETLLSPGRGTDENGEAMRSLAR